MLIAGSRFVSLALLLSAAAVPSLPAPVRFDDFASHQGLELIGAATVFDNALRLTPAKRNKVGATWLRQKQPILLGFDTTFQFRLTHQDRLMGGADGFAFVIENSGPRALGGRGSAGGFGVADSANAHEPGIPRSIAIFFDTCKNNEEGDPSADYIAVRATGRPANMHWPAARLAFIPKLAINLKDRKIHTARIIYRRPVIQIFLDDFTHPVLQTAVDLSLVADAEGKAWVGFTASTGFGFEDHDILSWSFQGEQVSSSVAVVSSEISFPMSACLPDHNLCTPERSFVSREGNSYHVILPGNLAWGVRIPNTQNATVAITNAHGTVCWDAKEQGFSGCSGPSGRGGHAGPGFLEEGASPGALLSRTRNGFTSFSVNGRTGRESNGNEGFYEFDVTLK